jgi:DNA-binding transcriptional LysR family regulator
VRMQQIRYFLAVCQELNFTAAARRCGVSQPTLTIAIGVLERELGGALFQRKPSVALSGLGCAVQPYLDQIARNADQAREVAGKLTRHWVFDHRTATQWKIRTSLPRHCENGGPNSPDDDRWCVEPS